MAVIGLDLGATKLAGALFDSDGGILERAAGLLEGRGGDEVGRLIVEQRGGAAEHGGGAGIRGGGGRRVGAGDRASRGWDGLGAEHRRVGAVSAARRAPRGGGGRVPGGGGERPGHVDPGRGVARRGAGLPACDLPGGGHGDRRRDPRGRVDPERGARHRGRDRVDGAGPSLPGGIPSLRRVRVARIGGGDRAGGSGAARGRAGIPGDVARADAGAGHGPRGLRGVRGGGQSWRRGWWPTRWNAGGWRSPTW